MKEEILRLRDEGKSYREIVKILGCSKSTVAYHCGKGQKEKNAKRRKKRRENPLVRKTDQFRLRKSKEKTTEKKEERSRKDVVEGIRKFQKTDSELRKYGSDGINKNIESTFTWQDVLNKFGENTHCYLSGEPIDLMINNYQFDHIRPVSRKGGNELDNLGIAHEVVNQMKGDLLPEELIDWCKKILIHNGYTISK